MPAKYENKTTRMGTRAEIVQMFMHAAEHIDQCYNFDIQKWLDKYENMENEMRNFSEAAFLVYSAARIYSRKVDYLENVVLEWNQRAEAEAAAVAADKKAAKEEAAGGTAKSGANDEGDEVEATPKHKEKPRRGTKKLLKSTGRIEFKPKEFTVAELSQISLNLDQQRIEDEFNDERRLKNIFPRINVLQSNLRSNNRFFENLGLIDADCDNPDTLRDYRLFMDTIDEPIRTSFSCPNIEEIMSYDPSKNGGKPKVVPKELSHCSILFPAAYLKEQYNIIVEDNSDYLNMLRYNEEIRRLNLKDLSVEQLVNLKVGTYLNDVLHGTNVSGRVPPLDDHTTTIDAAVLSRLLEDHPVLTTTARSETTLGQMDQSSLVLHNFDDTAELSTIAPDESTLNDTTMHETTVDESSIMDSTQAETTGNATVNTTTPVNDESMADATINATIETTTNDSTAANDSVTVKDELNESEELESMFNAVVQLNDIFHGSNELPSTVDLNGPLGDVLKSKEAQKVALTSNIFQLPENLLRRQKIFKLTEDFDLWLAARKRKLGNKPGPGPPKVFKMFDGTMVMVSGMESDTRSCISDRSEDFFGFDQHGNISSLSFSVVRTQPECSTTNLTNLTDFNNSELTDPSMHPDMNSTENCAGSIVNRAYSNDSGIIENDRTTLATGIDLGFADLGPPSSPSNAIANVVDKVNAAPTEVDSGFSEIDCSVLSKANDTTVIISDADSALVAADTTVDTLKAIDETLPFPETSLADMSPDEEDPNVPYQNEDAESTASGSNMGKSY